MSTTLPSGSTFGAYTIEAVIARGGMGVVYRATQLQPRRRIALKLIAPEHAGESAYRERFLRETDLLASLEHPNIVPIHAAGEWEGQLYLAMRYIDGPDLGTYLVRQGPLSLARTIEILGHVANALDAAHDEGLVHRDIKPANILLSEKGAVYLTDFGLTKRADSDSGLTRPGQAIGTAGYMAPEQFTGTSDPALAQRIDVYALGCVLHACLTGVEPYPRDSYEQALFAHVHAPPPTVSDRANLPRAVDDVLAKALAKDPLRRFARAGDVVEALRAAMAMPVDPDVRLDEPTVAVPGPTSSVPPPPTSRRRLTPMPESIGPVPASEPDPGPAAVPSVRPVPQLATQAATPPPPGRGANDDASLAFRSPARRASSRRPPLWSLFALTGIAVLGGLVVFLLASDLLHIGPRADHEADSGHVPASASLDAGASIGPAASLAASPGSSPSSSPSVRPSLGPTADPGASFGTATDVAAALERVPLEIRGTCVSEQLTGRAVASLRCRLASGDLVWYDSYATLDDLRGAIEGARSAGNVPTTSEDCSQGLDCVTTWGYENQAPTEGKLVIWTFETSPFLEYSAEYALVKVTHVGVLTNRPALYQQWLEAPLPIDPRR
jgi:serine/threonine protein kinase